MCTLSRWQIMTLEARTYSKIELIAIFKKHNSLFNSIQTFTLWLSIENFSISKTHTHSQDEHARSHEGHVAKFRMRGGGED